MLDSLRDFAKSWPGKIMGGFLLVGVAGFGINNVITDLGSSTVARVGNEEISSREFLQAYQVQLNQVAQQLGSVPTPQEAMNFGIPGMVLERLAQDAALDQMAGNLGLGVSETKLSEMLREDPNFQGTLGTFDPEMFPQVLQMSGLTEAQYLEQQASSARRQQLVLSLFGDAQLPEAAAQLVRRYSADQRTVDYFVLGDTNIPTPPPPTQEELAAYLAEHQAEFRTVETRTVQMLRLSAAELAANKTIAEEAIAAEYERTKASLSQPERRTIQQVVLSEQQATAFEAGLAAGRPFEALVSENGLTPTELGTLAQNQVTDQTLAAAAFGLPQGGFAVIEGVAGKRAVHVSAIEAGGEPTLEEAREQIRQNLALAEARNELADVQDQIEELRAAFRPLPEIAERFGLDVYQADLTAGGAELSVIPELAAEDRPRITQAVFKAQNEQLTPSIALAGNGHLWFDLEKIEPARDQTLEEVRDRVVQALTEERVNNAVLAAAEGAVQRLDNGEALADVAGSFNVFPQLSTPFSRFGASDGSIDRTVASAVFAGGADHHGMAVNEAGETIVFKVVDVVAATGPLDPQASDALENEARNGLYGDFVAAVRADAELRVNETALNQALALNTPQ
jgi:peptidyl-prolyl cis-trans isomerase D